MRHARRPAISALIAVIALAAPVMLALAGPVFAKEGLAARLDAPIAGDSPAGAELAVGMMVTVLDGSIMRPVEGSPIYLELIGPGGETNRAFGRWDATPGHYTFRIAVPPGGVAEIEVGIQGSTDSPFEIAGTALVAGAITSATTQIAPPLQPGDEVERPRPSPGEPAAPAAVVAEPAAISPATVSAPAAAAVGAVAVTQDTAGIDPMAVLAIGLIAAAVLAWLTLVRRSGRKRSPAALDAHDAAGADGAPDA